MNEAIYQRFEKIGLDFGREFSIIPANDNLETKFNGIIITPDDRYVLDINMIDDVKFCLLTPPKIPNTYIETHLIAYLMFSDYEIKYHDFVPQKENEFFAAAELNAGGDPKVTTYCWNPNSRYQKALLDANLAFKYESGVQRLIKRETNWVRQKLQRLNELKNENPVQLTNYQKDSLRHMGYTPEDIAKIEF